MGWQDTWDCMKCSVWFIHIDERLMELKSNDDDDDEQNRKASHNIKFPVDSSAWHQSIWESSMIPQGFNIAVQALRKPVHGSQCFIVFVKFTWSTHQLSTTVPSVLQLCWVFPGTSTPTHILRLNGSHDRVRQGFTIVSSKSSADNDPHLFL